MTYVLECFVKIVNSWVNGNIVRQVYYGLIVILLRFGSLKKARNMQIFSVWVSFKANVWLAFYRNWGS